MKPDNIGNTDATANGRSAMTDPIEAMARGDF